MKIRDYFIIDTEKLIKDKISVGNCKTFPCTREQAEKDVAQYKGKTFQITHILHNGTLVCYEENGQNRYIGTKFCKKNLDNP
jgi:hypothetical protein